MGRGYAAPAYWRSRFSAGPIPATTELPLTDSISVRCARISPQRAVRAAQPGEPAAFHAAPLPRPTR